MGLFAKRKRTTPSGPRKNQWKGQRVGQVGARNPGSRPAGGSKLIWWGGLTAGFVLIGYQLTGYLVS